MDLLLGNHPEGRRFAPRTGQMLRTEYRLRLMAELKERVYVGQRAPGIAILRFDGFSLIFSNSDEDDVERQAS